MLYTFFHVGFMLGCNTVVGVGQIARVQLKIKRSTTIMKSRIWKRMPAVTAICAVTLALCGASSALAQGPGGPMMGGPGMGGPMMGGPMMGGPMMGGSALNLPMPVLKSGLGLSVEQSSKIAAIQKSFRAERQSMGMGRRRGPGGPPPGGPGGPPPMMMQNMMKMRVAMQADEKKIVDVLDSSQKAKLPRLLNVTSALDMAGIGAGAFPVLHLTSSQEQRLSEVTVATRKKMQSEMMSAMQNRNFQQMRTDMQTMRTENRASVMAVLSASQKAEAESYARAHPRRGPGMMGGGMGGPPPGPPQ